MTSSVQKKRARKKNITYMLFLLPGLVYLVINNYIPMMGVFIAFKISIMQKEFLRATGSAFRISDFYLRPEML